MVLPHQNLILKEIDLSDLKRSAEELSAQVREERQRIFDYEARGEAEYRKWLHLQYGKQIQSIQVLSNDIEDVLAHIRAVEVEADVWRCSMPEAYRRVQARKDAGTPLIPEKTHEKVKKIREEEALREAEAAAEFERLRNLARDADELRAYVTSELAAVLGESDFEALDPIEREELIRESMQEFLDEAHEEDEEDRNPSDAYTHNDARNDSRDRDPNDRHDSYSGPGENGGTPPRPSPTEEDALLKKLFRELAFKLHPDQNRDQDPQDNLTLWNQVQSAYQYRDLNRLRYLAGGIRLKAVRDPKKEDESWLKQFIVGLRVEWDSLQNIQDRYFQKLSWRFWLHRDEPDSKGFLKLKRKVSTEMQRQVRDLTRDINLTKMALNNYAPRNQQQRLQDETPNIRKRRQKNAR